MKTILIVDDEFAIVETLTDLLDEEGYSVMSAGNGRVALELLDRRAPDLMLVDIMMPVLDGRELVTRMQSRPEWAAVPVVFMSAVPQSIAFARGGKPPPFYAFLRKPFDLHALLAILKKLFPQGPG
jgi:two-component system response regulator VicR